ncbi:glycosyltransferase family 2 protein [Frankia sp. ACN1ag]|uniref:glycosyltransferase family 2 protein n=1 Tax=Frankia sp. ACN1ag TaxID=102891 RepID=UPI0006DC4D35|nr:glycosyltransferase family 2 protein [Frankia sp. ACN1ag]KQC38814.1 glycosyltransferase [Frankia sp. ACN1ag]
MLTESDDGRTPVDVVLPCLDEAGALPWVLDRIPAGYRAIVADNGSRDGSAEVARGRGATVVAVPERGYGAAVHAGLLAADADVVCVCDADASLDPARLPDLVALLATDLVDPTVGRADLVLGRRRPTSLRAWPPPARLGNAAVARRLRRRGVPVRDLGPMRAARRADLLALSIADRRFGYPLELLLRAAQAGWRIAETDVAYTPRIGRSKVTGTPLGAARAVRDMSTLLARLP